MFHIDVYLKMKRRQKFIVWASAFLALLGIGTGTLMYINGSYGLGQAWVILGGLLPILVILMTAKKTPNFK